MTALIAMIEIRAGRQADKSALVRILRASFLATWAPIVPDEANAAFAATDEPERFTEQCWQDFHVADREGQIVGLIFVHGDKIESLHLDPDEKRKGYGSLLMDRGEDLVRKNGHTTAQLDVLVKNENALLFYKARGYTIVKEFTGLEVGDTPVPMYLMSRDLKAA